MIMANVLLLTTRLKFLRLHDLSPESVSVYYQKEKKEKRKRNVREKRTKSVNSVDK